MLHLRTSQSQLLPRAAALPWGHFQAQHRLLTLFLRNNPSPSQPETGSPPDGGGLGGGGDGGRISVKAPGSQESPKGVEVWGTAEVSWRLQAQHRLTLE